MIRKKMKRLVRWKKASVKKPLFVFGAKGVGKSYLLKDFGKNEFEDLVYVNCESNIFSSDIFNDNIQFYDIVKKLELIFNKVIDKDSSLIVFDEIEKNPVILKSLLESSQNSMEYYVASIMSTSASYAFEKYSINPEIIDYVTISPLSFEEFLINTQNEELALKIWECFNSNEPMPGLLHKKAFDLYYDYLIVGGIPEAVNEYINTSSVVSSIDYQKNMIDIYKSVLLDNKDIKTSKKVIQTYESIPSQLFKNNKKFKYKLVENGSTSNYLADSIMSILDSCLAFKCCKIEASEGNNLVLDPNSFVLYLNDVGLLTYLSEFPIYFIRNRDAVNEKMYDILSKNYIACSLKDNNLDLYYWKNKYDSKLDFVVKMNDTDLIPIEVKSDNSVKSRSLCNFMNTYNPKYGIRLSTKNFSFKTNIKYIPLYAAFCINKNNLE